MTGIIGFSIETATFGTLSKMYKNLKAQSPLKSAIANEFGLYSSKELSRKLMHDPTLEEISKDCDIPAADILYALDAIQTPLSLFDPVYTDGGDTLYVMDQISDKKNKEESWVKNLVLDDALNLLDERARKIIRLRFYEGKTQIEVAEEINISQAQVSRLEKNALKNMQHYLNS